MIQIFKLSQYFLKVALDEKINYLYSILIPAVMIYSKEKILFGYHATEAQFEKLIIPWIGFIVLSAALSSIVDIQVLRIQGYFRIFHFVTKNDYVLVVAKLLIGIINMFVSILAIFILTSVTFHLNDLRFYIITGFNSVLLFVFLFLLCSILLPMDLKEKTITTLVSLILMLVLVITSFTKDFDITVVKTLIPTNFSYVLLRQSLHSFTNFTFDIAAFLYIMLGYISFSHFKLVSDWG